MDTDDCDPPDPDDDVEIQCGNCGYVWEYTGEMWVATCPNCGRKVKTPYNPEYEPDEDEE